MRTSIGIVQLANISVHNLFSPHAKPSIEKHRMFWLVHVHDGPSSFAGWNFAASIDWESGPVEIDGRQFDIMQWVGRSSQFIEKWKRATAHVFLSVRATFSS